MFAAVVSAAITCTTLDSMNDDDGSAQRHDGLKAAHGLHGLVAVTADVRQGVVA